MRAASNGGTSNCHASHHMRLQEYALWESCMRLTRGGRNRLYFDGRAMAAGFLHCSKSAIYNYRDNLIQKGWLEPLNLAIDGKAPRKANGQCSATELRVLTHDQWAKKHGAEQCYQSGRVDRSSPTEWTGPVQEIDSASPELDPKPVQPGGHSFVFSSVKESSVKPSFQLENSWNDESQESLLSRNQKTPTQEACRLAAKLKAEIRHNKPDFRVTPSQEQNWAVTAQRMLNIDQRKPEDISDLIEWVQRDEFWRTNVLSMDKLREKFDQLQMKRGQTSPKPTGRHSSFAGIDYTKGTEGFVVAGGAQ